MGKRPIATEHGPWEYERPDDRLLEVSKRYGMPVPETWVFLKGDGSLRALIGRENVGTEKAEDFRWHISVAPYMNRVPSWDELVFAAHSLRPGVTFIVGIPPESQWMSLHDYVIHLWESKDEGIERLWRNEALGARSRQQGRRR